MSAALVFASSMLLADPPPRHSGPDPAHHYAVGGVLLGVGALLRVRGVSIAFSDNFVPDGRDGSWARVMGGATAVSGAIATAHASYGLGWRRASTGRPTHLRPAAGWVLFGIGTSAALASRFLPLACFENACALALGEATTWAGFTLAGVGLNLATFAIGHRRGAYWSVAPAVSGGAGRRFDGLAVSGRF